MLEGLETERYNKMMLCLKTIKYLYVLVLRGLDYQEQLSILKPFYLLLALCLCVVLAIPICSSVLRMIEWEGT